MPADKRDVDKEVDVPGGGLDFGITLYELRILTDNPWDGGGGYTYREVARMTPDQIYHRICDRKALKRDRTGKRLARMSAKTVPTDEKGNVKVRTEDGKLISIPLGNKSAAKQLAEQ